MCTLNSKYNAYLDSNKDATPNCAGCWKDLIGQKVFARNSYWFCSNCFIKGVSPTDRPTCLEPDNRLGVDSQPDKADLPACRAESNSQVDYLKNKINSMRSVLLSILKEFPEET